MLGEILFSLVLFLAVGEVAARVALSQPAFLAQLATGGQTARELMMRSRASETDGPLLFRTLGLEHDPRLGWRGGPFRTPPGATPTVVVGQDGCRRTAPASFRPPAEGRTLVVMGDSFAFGDEVSDQDTFAWLLREGLGEEVHNHGVIGYGLDQVLLAWREQVSQDPPDVLVVGFSSLLHARVSRRWDSWAKPWFTLDGRGDLVLHGPPIPPPEAFGWSAWTPRLPWVARVYRERLAGTERIDALQQELTWAILQTLHDEVTAAGTRLVVAYLPTEGDLTAPAGPADAAPPARQLWERWCAERQVACPDPWPVMAEDLRDGVTLFGVSHWSPAGHRRVAEVLMEVLASDGPRDDDPGDPSR